MGTQHKLAYPVGAGAFAPSTGSYAINGQFDRDAYPDISERRNLDMDSHRGSNEYDKDGGAEMHEPAPGNEGT